MTESNAISDARIRTSMHARLRAAEAASNIVLHELGGLKKRVHRCSLYTGKLHAATKRAQKEAQAVKRKERPRGTNTEGEDHKQQCTTKAEELDPAMWVDFFSEDDVWVAVKVFEAMQDHREFKQNATTHDGFKRMLQAAGSVIKGRSDQEIKSMKKERTAAKREHDKQILAATWMRKKKVTDTNKKMSVFLPPPPVLGALTDSNAGQSSKVEEETVSAVAPVDVFDGTNTGVSENEDQNATAGKLRRKRKCWLCKAAYDEVHHFYDQFCPQCAAFNYTKRGWHVDLTNRIALVTGARVKIGYYIALKLLRCGATVIVQTRFPHDAVTRYAREQDFADWGHRVHVYGVDFRDIPAVHRFAHALKSNFPHLDILINNAAQTVRKPAGFYQHLLDGETTPLPRAIQNVVGNPEETVHQQDTVLGIGGAEVGGMLQGASAGAVAATTAKSEHVERDGGRREPGGLRNAASHANSNVAVPEGGGMSRAAAMSQLTVLPEDSQQLQEELPRGLLDEDNQQIDFRSTNSWQLSLGDISTSEYLECHLINATAPFTLNNELKALMLQSPAEDRYVVNVSAMEGQFYRKNKSAKHPHTNMAKAALNMMTRTAANEFADDGIYMTSVDTGWITDENPTQNHSHRNDTSGPPPLDHLDAAMRVLDPVFTGIDDKDNRMYNVFLKDYKVTHW